MKSKIILFTFVMMSLMLVGCTNNEMKDKISSSDLKEFSFDESKEYDCMELSYGNKTYRPFCAGEPKNLSEDHIVGYYKDDGGNKIYLFLLEGTDSENWLVTAYIEESGKIDHCNSYFIWKEITENNIPEEIEVEPEYKEWN